MDSFSWEDIPDVVNKKITFETFQKSRVFVPDARKCENQEVVDNYSYDMDVEAAQPILVYLGYLTIDLQTPSWPADNRDHMYSLTVENWSRESDDLEELEKVLYEWYLTS